MLFTQFECRVQLLLISRRTLARRQFGQATATITKPAMSAKKSFQRLPSNVRPRHYKLSIQPDLSNFTFAGKQSIDVEVLEATNTVTLNACDINIKSVIYNDETAKNVEPTSIDLDAEKETLKITFPQSLPVSKSGSLQIDFQGELNDKLRGFYRSKYISPDGTVKYAAVTQFEATDARRCFPCWDEPALRATFDITLTVSNELLALSNMPVKSTTPVGADKKAVEFDTTPIMPTYLVALVVGEYDYVEDIDADGVRVRVYTPKGKQEQGQFALHVATKVLPYYKKYFDIPYPLPKLDLIAIADFSAGAMENWGLATYRETCLLVDPNNTSAIVKQWVALVVGHELAHQWFGNYVTMEWWTHLWLKEGYASFLEFLCVDYLFPEFDIWTQFVTDTYIKALELDALKNSHPIEVPVGHPSEIDEIFDDISYNKGASVIRMLHSYIGEEDFRKGMNLYLKRHAYAHAQTEDLWLALEEASEKPVRHVMPTWTKKQGFPLLKVSEKLSNDNKRVLCFSQEKFFADGSVDTEDTTWVIPVAISSSEDPKKIIKNELIEGKTKEVEIEGVSKNSWLKVNPGVVGVYRTLYSDDLLDNLLPAIKSQSLPPLDRLGLLDDLFALSQAAQVSFSQVLKLLQAFQSERNYTVWSSIINCLSKIGNLVAHLEIHSKYKSFGQTLLKDIHAYLGWEKKENESHLDTLLRSLVLDRLVAFDNEATIAEAVKRFEGHKSGKAILPADLRSSVYRAAFSKGGKETFDELLKLYREADLHEEKVRILSSLGSTKDEEMLKHILNFALSDDVKPQDTVLVMMSVTRSFKGRKLAWQFFKDNYANLTKRCEGAHLIARLVKCTTEHFVSDAYAEDVTKFFEANPTLGAERTIQQSIETIKLNTAWLKRDQKAIEDFLNNIN